MFKLNYSDITLYHKSQFNSSSDSQHSNHIIDLKLLSSLDLYTQHQQLLPEVELKLNEYLNRMC